MWKIISEVCFYFLINILQNMKVNTAYSKSSNDSLSLCLNLLALCGKIQSVIIQGLSFYTHKVVGFFALFFIYFFIFLLSYLSVQM